MASLNRMSPQSQSQEEELEPGKLAVRLANAVVLPMALKSALELNVIDIIVGAGDGTFMSPSDIACKFPTKNPNTPVMLDRVLRLLASYSIVKCSIRTNNDREVERLYGAAPICKFLGMNKNEEVGGSAGPLFLLHHDKVFMQSWNHLNDVILGGGIPFQRAYGTTVGEFIATDERFNHVFNQAMSNHTTMVMNKILQVYKGFEGLQVLVDVGGGIGVNLSMIISKYPHLRGINFDMPHVLAEAPSFPGAEHVGGDMFEGVPKGDAIFLKWMLHGWSDDHCIKLLKNCWGSLPSTGKLIVVESILPVAPETCVSANIAFEQDLFMLAQTVGGKERTEKEYDTLAVKSGFSGCEVICCAYNSWVMEFHK